MSYTANAGPTEKIQIPFVTLFLGNEPSKVFRKRVQRCEASWLQAWPRMGFQELRCLPDLPSFRAKCRWQPGLSAKCYVIPGRSLSHSFQTRILDETSIQLKLHFLTNFPTLTQISLIY